MIGKQAAMVCFDAHGLPAMCARGDELFQIAAKEEEMTWVFMGFYAAVEWGGVKQIM